MIQQKIYLEKYKWEVVILYNTTFTDIDYIMDTLKEICDNKKDLYNAYLNISSKEYNTGFIYSNLNTKQSLILIGWASSKNELIDTIVHEANHLQSHIATRYNLDEKGEEVSYLIVDIVKRMYPIFKKLII